MNQWMSSFESLKDNVTFLTGMQSVTAGSHPAAGATWLVRPCPEGDRMDSIKDVGGASMDQVVARAVGHATPFASLELISRQEGYWSKDLLRGNISWRNGKTPVPRETEPRAILNRLTGGSNGSVSNTSSNKQQSSQRKSILDTVLEDARSLRRRVGASDQNKVEEYLEAVRGVEKRMGKLADDTRTAAREKAAGFPIPPEESLDDRTAYLRLMFDMLVLAYWTDSTRVSTFMLDHEQTHRYFNFLPGVQGMWHAISHWRDTSGRTPDDDGTTSWSSQEAKYEQYMKVIQYHHQAVAYFFKRLKSIREGEGTLLDNCMILYGSPFSDGNFHDSTNLPTMLAGGGGGKLKPGQLIEHPNAAAEGMYLSMMDVMGVPVHEFGGIDSEVRIA